MLKALGEVRGRYYQYIPLQEAKQIAVFKSAVLVGFLGHEVGRYFFELKYCKMSFIFLISDPRMSYSKFDSIWRKKIMYDLDVLITNITRITAADIFLFTQLLLLVTVLMHPASYVVPSVKKYIETKLIYKNKKFTNVDKFLMYMSVLSFFYALLMFSLKLHEDITTILAIQFSVIEFFSVGLFFHLHVNFMYHDLYKSN